MKVMTGAYVGSGAQLDVTSIGFKPAAVELVNKDGLVRAVFTQEMPAGTGFKQINHDSAQNVWITANGVTMLANGFRVGTDADLNTAGETVYWVAYEGCRLGA